MAGHKESSSVTKQLLLYQQGLPDNTLINTPTSTWMLKKRFQLLLLASRVSNLNGKNEALVASSLNLPLESQPIDNLKNSKEKMENDKYPQSDWIKFICPLVSRLQIGVAQNIIWTRCSSTWSANRNRHVPDRKIERIYTFSAHNFNFTLVKTNVILGQIIKCFILRNHPTFVNQNQSTTFLVTLTDCNTMCAYDLSTHKLTNNVKLFLDIPNRPKVLYYYKNMELCKESQKIIVLRTRVFGQLDLIAIFNYPPRWQTASLIYINTIQPLHFSISSHNNCNSICRILLAEQSDFYVLSWINFQQQTFKIPATNNDISHPVTFIEERELRSIPSTHIRFNLHCRANKYYNMEFCPIMTIMSSFGVGFYNVNPFQPLDLFPIYHYQNRNWTMGIGITNITPIPDGSSKVVINNLLARDSVMLEFQKYAGKIIVKEKMPFHNNSTLTTPPTQTEQKQERKCCVLAMSYCDELGLLAVLFADNPSQFHVRLYESFHMSLFKKFSPVALEPESFLLLYEVSEVSLIFCPEFILVTFEPNIDTIPNNDVFFCRLLSEKISIV